MRRHVTILAAGMAALVGSLSIVPAPGIGRRSGAPVAPPAIRPAVPETAVVAAPAPVTGAATATNVRPSLLERTALEVLAADPEVDLRTVRTPIEDALHRVAPLVAALDPGTDAVTDGPSMLTALRKLDVLADGTVDQDRLADVITATRDHLRPALAAAGVPVRRPVRTAEIDAALHAYGIDRSGPAPAAADVDALRDAVRQDLHSLVAAAGEDVDPADPAGLPRLLQRLRVDFGTVVDPPDVAHARARAATVLEERAAAERAERAPEPPGDAGSAWRDVHGSLQHRRFSLPGPVDVNVVRWRLDDPSLDLRADYATAPGRRASVPDVAAATGAVAAVNGGFWVDGNDPDGLLIRDGWLLSDTTALTDGHRNIRGGFGLTSDGGWVVGVPKWLASVEIDGTRLRVDGVNRSPFSDGELVLLTPGVTAQTPMTGPGRYIRLPMPAPLTASMSHQLEVLEDRRSGPLPLTDGTMVLYATPAAGERLPDQLDSLRFDLKVDPAWEHLEDGLAAGPWLLRNGDLTSVGQWRDEGFDANHTDRRHPRSAIGFTPDGWGVIVTVDGRRPEHSIGMTTAETARFMAGLGVTDAVMLDGGGSSQLVVGGELVNRPCCDSPERAVTTVLTIVPR